MNKFLIALLILSLPSVATMAVASASTSDNPKGGKSHIHILAAQCDKTDELVGEINYLLNDYHKAADMQWQDDDGNNILHEAAAFGCYENVKAILTEYTEKNVADYINETNKKGETPLDKAHYNKHMGTEKFLRRFGAKYNIFKDAWDRVR